jgi:CelD/BcsL family acetyltransferase involved in cellulose biosynthesis
VTGTEARAPVVVDPRDDPRWEELVRGGRGSLFTSPPWIRAVAATYGFTPQGRVLNGNDGAPRAGLALVDVDDVRGVRRVSLPFGDRADPIVGPAADQVDLEALLADRSPDIPWTVRALEPTGLPTVPGAAVTGRAAWHATTIEGSAEDAWARLSGSARRNVRAAARKGVTVGAGTGVEAVRTFHGLHVARRKRRYGMLAPPVALFDAIWREFSGDGSVVTLLASVEGRTVAGALFCEWDGVLYYKFGASLDVGLDVRPNDALFWAGIEHAHARGLRSLDWGVSDLDQPGLIGFKRKWADVECSVVTVRFGPRPSSASVDAILATVTALLTDPTVPDEVSARAGRDLYRYFC